MDKWTNQYAEHQEKFDQLNTQFKALSTNKGLLKSFKFKGEISELHLIEKKAQSIQTALNKCTEEDDKAREHIRQEKMSYYGQKQ